MFVFFFFKQKTAYEMRISDWSSDVCSSDLIRRIGDPGRVIVPAALGVLHRPAPRVRALQVAGADGHLAVAAGDVQHVGGLGQPGKPAAQSLHDPLPVLDAGAEPRRARGKIALVEIVRSEERRGGKEGVRKW